MKAMILAAGFGTRLKPLTDTMPKPLIEVKGRPMIDWVLASLQKAGVAEVVVNCHYLPETMLAHFANYVGPLQVRLSVEEGEILGTGGGLFACRQWLEGEDFLLCNADILCTADLSKLVAAHRASGALATLLTHEKKSRGMLLVDERGDLAGRTRADQGLHTLVGHPQGEPKEIGFAAFHMIGKDYFNWVKEPKFDLIDQYLELVGQGQRIATHPMEPCYWNDIGDPASLEAARRDFPGI